MRPVRWAAVLLAAGACSDDPGEELPGDGGSRDGGPVEMACGPVVEPSLGTECDTFADCPGTATDSNVGAPSPGCDQCLPFARARICEAGRCRRIDSTVDTLIQGNVEGNRLTTASDGYAFLLMSSLTSDGRRVSCRELVSTCDWTDPRLNIIETGGGGALFPPNQQVETFTRAPEAQDLIYMVLATEVGGGRGEVITVGCADGIDTVFGETTLIPEEIVLEDPWPPQ